MLESCRAALVLAVDLAHGMHDAFICGVGERR